MAFNAGSIEGTLTLNRQAFTEGLRRAKADAEKFAKQKFEVKITPKIDRADLLRIKQQIERVTGNIKVKVSLDNASLQAIKQRIERTTSRIKVRLDIDEAALRARLDRFRPTIKVKLNVPRSELIRIKQQIERISPVIRIRIRYDRSALDDLTRRIRGLNRGGGGGDGAFGGMDRTLRTVLALLPLLLPVAASAINGVVGLVGGLISILGVLGVAFGAVAIVAVPIFKKIQDGASKSYAEIAKLPPGIREGAKALKDLNKEVEKLTKATQKNVGLAFAAAFRAAQDAVRPLAPLINATSLAAARGFEAFSKYFKSSEYKDFLNFVKNAIGPALDKVFNIILNLTRSVFNLVKAFWPLGSWLLDNINTGLEKFAKWTGTLAGNKDFNKWLDGVKDSLSRWWDLLKNVGIFLWKLIQDLKPLGDKIVTFISNLFEAINKLPPGQLGAITLGLAAFFSTIMLAGTGPWGLVIGGVAGLAGALLALYDNNEQVHKSLDSFVGWLKSEWQPIWDKIKDNFNKYIQPAWNKLVETAEKNLPGAFEKVKKAYEEHIKPTFGPLIESLTGKDGLIPAFLDFADVVLPHVIDALTGTITDIEGLIGGLITIFSGVFTTIGGVFTTFAGLFSGDWEKFGKGLEDIGKGFLTIVAGIFGKSYDDIIKEGQTFERDMDNWWAGFWGGTIDTTEGKTYETRGVIGRFFDGIHEDATNFENTMDTWWANTWDGWNKFVADGWQHIKDTFAEFGPWASRTMAEAAAGIDKAWRAVANFFAEPINWVINVVLNNGILGAWNTVMGWIGQPQLSAKPIPNIPRFATGGQVVGPGSGTSDSIPALLSNGEFIVSAQRAKQHAHFLAALNAGQAEAVQAAGGANDPNKYPRYAAGGPVEAGLNFARAQQGKPYVWGAVGPGGYDCSGFMSAIANTLMGRNPYSRLGTTASAPWPGWAAGLTSSFGVGWYPPGRRGTGHMAGTLAGNNVESGSGHGPLVGPGALGATNFPSAMSLPQVGGQFIGGGPGGGGGQSVSWWSLISGKVLDLFTSLMPANPYGGIVGQAAGGFAIGAVNAAKKAIQAKLEKLMTFISFGGGPATGTPGDPSVTAAVRAVATSMGWGDGAEWDAIMKIVAKESGWNPLAANPTSSARGLFQKMTSIHGPVEGTPEGQAQWGLNYIRSRYGTPTAAWAFHQAHNYYDRGGMLGPGIAPINAGSHAERILSPQQTSDFHTLVGMLQDLLTPGTITRGDTYHVMLPVGASVRELANEIEFRKRVADKGRYRPR